MSPPDTQRALQVCSTCKARKKRCDKKIPNCGYCAERRLKCHYDTSFPSRRTDAAVRGSATWHCRMTAITTDRVDTSSANASKTVSAPPATSLYDFLRMRKGMALSDILNKEVFRVAESAGMSIREICDRFFDGFHHWLPAISPQRFRKANIDFHDRAPKADFSVLLLAMCLITLRPPASTVQQSSTCLTSLYTTVRFFFAQVQAVICASAPLIQAGILVAAYEYACQRPETAYISIGSCARMSGIVGINRGTVRWDNGQPDAESTLQVLEERNVWWCVIIMERLILVEIADRRHHSMTDFPSDDFHLPLDLGHDLQCDSQLSAATQSKETLLSATHKSKVDRFGRQAQAIAMLDQILRILSISDTEVARLPALVRLDEQLQAFLTLIMSEYRMPGRHCNANATVIRTLFLLHEGILSQPMKATSETTDGKHGASSWAALDTAARMMAAIAGHHVEHVANIDVLPICAAYNAQNAMEHIAARRDYIGRDSGAALESLQSLEGAFRRRWPAHEDLC